MFIKYRRNLEMRPRAKSGLMHGREFLMKDMYSFQNDEKSTMLFMKKYKKLIKIYSRLGIGHQHT